MRSHPVRPLASSVYLLAFFLDDLLGFYLLVPPLACRTTWVLFDRYFQTSMLIPGVTVATLRPGYHAC